MIKTIVKDIYKTKSNIEKQKQLQKMRINNIEKNRIEKLNRMSQRFRDFEKRKEKINNESSRHF